MIDKPNKKSLNGKMPANETDPHINEISFSYRPIFKLIQDIKQNTDALLAVDDFSGLLLRLETFYDPKPDYQLILGHSESDIENMIEETIVSFPGHEEQKQALERELEWAKAELGSGRYAEVTGYIIELKSALSNLIADGQYLGTFVTDFYAGIGDKPTHP